MLYAVFCEKGGVGKTATAEAMSDGLRLRGQRVLAVDVDPQTSLTAAMNADRSKPTLYDLLTGNATPAEAVQTTGRGDLIAGDRSLADIRSASSGALRDVLEELRGRYDSIVIDTPPGRGVLSALAAVAADELIIVVNADPFSLQALGNVNATLQKAARQGETVKIRGILIARYAARTVVCRELADMIEDAAGKMGTQVFQTRIRECTAIRTAQAARQSVFYSAPRSNAAQDYAAFLDELTGAQGHV